MRSPRSAGFSLVEVVIALGILTCALFGAISVVTYTTRLNTATRERTLAMRAAERKVEKMLSCGDFTEIYLKFKDQVDGVGWEHVDGLEPVDLTALNPPVNPPPDAPAYNWPTDPTAPRPVLIVRFPLADASSFTEVGSGQFTETYRVDAQGKPLAPLQYQDFHFEGKSIPPAATDTFLTSQMSDPVLGMKLLPVSIEVYWKGIGGITTLKYRYVFFKDPLK